MSEFDIYERKDPKRKIPEAFRQEIKEYIGQMQPEEDQAKYVGREFVKAELEDTTHANALQDMQEMANAPFGPNGMSKEEYAAQIRAIEEAAAKHDHNPEPEVPPMTYASQVKLLED